MPILNDPQPPFNSIRRALDALIRRADHYADEAQKHTPPTSDLMRDIAEHDRAGVDAIRRWLDGDTPEGET